MTTKKDALLEDLARLAVRHSSSDWLHAAESFEEIARLARMLTEKAGTIKKTKQRIRIKGTRPASKSDVSPLTETFARYLSQEISSRSGPNLREVANYLGMKSDLPRGAVAIVGAMSQHLDSLSIEDRETKIRGAISFIESGSPTQSDHYDRWVSLITKK